MTRLEVELDFTRSLIAEYGKQDSLLANKKVLERRIRVERGVRKSNRK